MKWVDFEDDKGRRQEFMFAHGEPIPEEMDTPTGKMRRVWSKPQAKVSKDIHFTTNVVDPLRPGEKPLPGVRYDETGMPQFDSRKDIQHFVSENKKACEKDPCRQVYEYVDE